MNNVFTTETFETTPLGVTSSTGGLALQDLQLLGFNTANHTMSVFLEVWNELDASKWWQNWGGDGRVARGPDYIVQYASGGVRIVFLNSVSAFGLDLMVGSLPGGGSVVIKPNGNAISSSDPNFANGTVLTYARNATSADRAYFGLISSTPIAFVDIENGTGVADSFVLVDNISFGNPAAETLEPSTLMLLGSGLVAMGVWKRTRRQRATA